MSRTELNHTSRKNKDSLVKKKERKEREEKSSLNSTYEEGAN